MAGNQVSNLDQASKLAQALLLEQVGFIRKSLVDHQNIQQFQTVIQNIYTYSDQILLKDLVKLEQLQQVVIKYAFQLNLGADLLEFIGTIAQKIHRYITQQNDQLQHLISDEMFSSWLYKILELDQARFALKQLILKNEKAQQISLQLANQILESNTPYLDQLRKFKHRDQRWGDALKSRFIGFIQEQQHQLELKLEQQLSQAILKQLGHILTLPSDELAEIALDLWSELKYHKVSDHTAQIQAIDVEELFILVYETWKDLRQTDFIQAVVLDVVKAFYDDFSNHSLQELIESVGLTQNDLLDETIRFVPNLIQSLDQLSLLEKIIQLSLQPFYESENTLQLIHTHLSESN